MSIKLEQQDASPDTALARSLISVERTLLGDWPVIIAGGSVRKALFRQELGKSDIDVFFKDGKDTSEAAQYMSSIGATVRTHPNCIGINLEPGKHAIWPSRETETLYLQLITKAAYPSMEELLEKFDFTVCQFGYQRGKFYFPAEAYQHEVCKYLERSPGASKTPSFTRYAKYLGLGYTPSIELFERVFITDRSDLRIGSETISDIDDLYGGI